MHTGLFHEIDFDADGKTLSFLGTPYSVDRSPITRSRPRSAASAMARPRVLLMAGNHGDEYEGEIALGRLIRRLDPARVRGEITILPMANVPAVMAARRRSPLDNGNLNRAFRARPAARPPSGWRISWSMSCFRATTWSSTSTPAARRWRTCPPR